MGTPVRYGSGIAYKDFEIVAISSGVVTLSDGNLITLSAETGTTDDLDTITSNWDGLTTSTNTYRPMIILRADVGDTITLKHNQTGAANIYIPGGGDVTLTENNMAVMLDNGTNYVLFNVVGQAATFTVTNWTNDVALDCDAAAVAETNDVLGTLIKHLIAAGVIGGTVSA
jgi:hypothetical protein